MSVQWYPGHMRKARQEIAQAIPGVDILLELVDARLPRSSSNPVLAELRGARLCLKLLNKADLTKPTITTT